jgi:3-deoxy-D-manno-octulosonic-acid transferase/heptosyltransferase-1
MNILMIKLSAIGDVIHTLPALSALRKKVPDAHITWVIEETAADLIMDHPALDRVIISRRKSWLNDVKTGRFGRPIKEFIKFVQALRDRPYDLVIDFHGLFKSAVIVLLSGGRRKLGYDSMQELSGLFYSEKIPEDMKKHAVDRYLDFLHYLGANVEAPEFAIPIGKDRQTHVASILQAEGIDIEKPFVAVSPVALWETKLWQDEKFARLCDRIVGELNIPVIITGSAHEKPYTESIIKEAKTAKVVNLAGQTTLKDLACLYRQAAVVVTTDSGPMHIATAVGTPVVALFGPTDPRRTGPYGPGHTVISKALPCSPCFLKTCESQQCMRDITVEEVFEAVKEKLEETNKAGIGKEGL